MILLVMLISFDRLVLLYPHPLSDSPCLILRLSYLLQDDRSDENKREGAAIESGLRWLEDRSNSMIGIADLIEITSQ